MTHERGWVCDKCAFFWNEWIGENDGVLPSDDSMKDDEKDEIWESFFDCNGECHEGPPDINGHWPPIHDWTDNYCGKFKPRGE